MMRPFRHLAFERVLAAWLAKRLCDGCGKPLGAIVSLTNPDSH
jgi:hypothetical protein